MLPLDTRLVPNHQEVAAQVIEGEAMMINLSTGVYYSLDKAGSTLWTLLADGVSLGEAATALARYYAIDENNAQSDVQRVVEELIRENLVRVSHDSAPAPNSERTDHLPAVGSDLTYEGLQLNVYRDMGDLLALDPPMPGLEDIPWKPIGP